MHQWYDYGRGSVAAPPEDELHTITEITGQGKGPTLLTKAEIEKYGIVELYSDVALTQFVSYAIKQEENFLTIAWGNNIPSELFIKTTTKGVSSSPRITLQVKPEKAGDLALYTLYSLSKLTILSAPHEGSWPLHFIYFDQGKVYELKGTAIGKEKILLDQKPPQNALVLFDFEGENSPYGFYQVEKNKFIYLDDYPLLDNYATLSLPEEKNLNTLLQEQKFYVLENEFQQFVFTNINGAVAEVNLPFYSEEHPRSVVHPIEIDRIIAQNYPANNTYPQFPYYLPDGKGGATDLVQPKFGGYYPLLRRNIIGSKGRLLTKINPHYYALNVFQEDQSLDAHVYELKRYEKDLIEFEFSEGNRRITKTYTWPKRQPDIAPYCLNLTIKIEGDARGLSLNTGIPTVELISGNFTPALKYRVTRNQKRVVENVKPPKEGVTFQHIYPDWVCNGNGFFGVIIDPLTKPGAGFSFLPIPGELVPTNLSMIDAQYHRYPADKYPGYDIHLHLMSKPGVSEFRIFAGPFDKQILQRVDDTFTDPLTHRFPDYISCQNYTGWFAFISEPFAKFLFFLMNFFHTVTSSWGISIILLTIALRIMLYPLNNWSLKSLAKMQQIGPQTKAIQEKYKKDPQKVRLEIMNLYRKEGVNPFGGCLPMLIQLPFVFGMLDLLKSSFELRGASFIPGWIDNLTAPDDLFSWSYPIPFIGNSFHFLPILLGAIMYIQQRYSLSAQAKGALTDQQKQQRSMGNIMTIVFTVLFYHFPSGLNIYWISTTLLGILQQWWINKKTLEKTKVAGK